MKTLLALIPVLALVSCSRVYWSERQIPTTDVEKLLVKSHVEAVVNGFGLTEVGGDDQDLEDIIIEAHNEARKSFCHPTLWEYYESAMFDSKASGWTGRWRYADPPEPEPEPEPEYQ